MKVQCRKCGCIVEIPKRKWQMNYCGCGAIAVDISGDSYRIVGNDEDYEILKDVK